MGEKKTPQNHQKKLADLLSKLDQPQDKIALAIKTALGVKSVAMLANQETKLLKKILR